MRRPRLPFVLVVDPPVRADLQWLWRRPAGRRTLVAAVGAGLGVPIAGRIVLPALPPDHAALRLVAATGLLPAGRQVNTEAQPAEEQATTLQVTSLPDGGQIEINGRGHGTAPATLRVAAGVQRVSVRLPGHAGATYRMETAPGQHIEHQAELWLRAPAVEPLRPPFPGATIEVGHFLADGRVALSIVLPPDNETQLWLAGVSGEAARRLGPPGTRGPLAPAPDGQRVAYLAPSPARAGSSAPASLTEVWIAEPGGERGTLVYALPQSPAQREARLVDLSWSPDGTSLLLAGRRHVATGGARTWLARLDVRGGALRELATLPSEVVAGSYLWSGAHDRVALLVRSAQATALCVVDARPGGAQDGATFQYVADITRGGSGATAAQAPPAAWSPDGEVLAYTAPRPGAGAGGVFGTKTAPATLAAAAFDPSGAVRYSGAGDHPFAGRSDLGAAAPVWRRDGVMAALVRLKRDGPLGVRALDPEGRVLDLATLSDLTPRTGASLTVRWDAQRAQALVTVRAPGSTARHGEYWLVRLRQPPVATAGGPGSVR